MPTPQLRPRLHGGAFTPIFACVAASLAASAAAQTRFSFETRGCVGATPIVFTADSGLLALAGNGADILLFDLVKRKEAAVLEHADEGQAPAGISHIALSPDSRTLAAVYSGDLSDREIVFFDVERRARRGTVPLKSGLTASAFFPDGSKFIAAVLNADAKRPMEVRVWDSASVEQIKSLDEAPSVASIAFSRDGKWLATSHGVSPRKSQVILWDAATLERRRKLRSAGGWPRLAFSPDSRLLAAGISHYHKTESGMTGVQLWDVQSGKQLAWMDGFEKVQNPWEHIAPVFAPGGDLLAATYVQALPDDSQIKLWNISTGEMRVLERDRNAYASNCYGDAKFSPDGTLLATAANFGQPGQFGVRIWETKFWMQAALLDMSSGIEPVAPLPAHPPLKAVVDNIQFSPDGKWLAARRAMRGGTKHDVFLWKVSEALPGTAQSPGR